MNVFDRENLLAHVLAIRSKQAADTMRNIEDIRFKKQIGVSVNQKKGFLKTKSLNKDNSVLNGIQELKLRTVNTNHGIIRL